MKKEDATAIESALLDALNEIDAWKRAKGRAEGERFLAGLAPNKKLREAHEAKAEASEADARHLAVSLRVKIDEAKKLADEAS